MSETEFKTFPKIERFKGLRCKITQKMHGTNAHIHVFINENGQKDLLCASRTKYLRVGDDNFGFAAFVEANKAEFLRCLSEGRHYGEWCGPGINSGEGLDQKVFFLFNPHSLIENCDLPPSTRIIPFLFEGEYTAEMADIFMGALKEHGSKAVPGFMRPEGIVIQINDIRYKKVFDPEETKWCQKRVIKPQMSGEPLPNVSHLLQPIRLEKLLSRDEVYLRDYPQSLKRIATDYVKDLTEEKQFDPEDKELRKSLGRNLFVFLKEFIEKGKTE